MLDRGALRVIIGEETYRVGVAAVCRNSGATQDHQLVEDSFKDRVRSSTGL